MERMQCPRCQASLEPMVNGSTVWLRCTAEPPGCGVIWPVETARAELAEHGGGFPKDDPTAVTVPGGRVRPLTPPTAVRDMAKS